MPRTSAIPLLLTTLAASSVLASSPGAHGAPKAARRHGPDLVHTLAARATQTVKDPESIHWQTINGVKYPKELGPDAPMPVITDNWWLDEVQKNDTTIHKFSYSDLPDTSETGQTGTNRCSGANTDDSMCQTLLLNSAEDFCLWGPPTSGKEVSVTEEIEVAWCTKDHGARQIPNGALHSVHFVSTPAYLQVTGTGDLTKLNIKKGDEGGELDPHGATGNGNPIGGLVYTTAWSSTGKHEQISEWMMEISATSYCFRGCKGTDYVSQMLCTHIYDEMGCDFIMPASYEKDVFESCEGDVALAPGIISTWTFTEGDSVTPSARSKPSSSKCATVSSPVSGSASKVSATGSAKTSSKHKSSSSSSTKKTNKSSTSVSSSASLSSSSSSSAVFTSAAAAAAAAVGTSTSTSSKSSTSSSSSAAASAGVKAAATSGASALSASWGAVAGAVLAGSTLLMGVFAL